IAKSDPKTKSEPAATAASEPPTKAATKTPDASVEVKTHTPELAPVIVIPTRTPDAAVAVADDDDDDDIDEPPPAVPPKYAVAALDNPTYRLSRTLLRKRVGRAALGPLREASRTSHNPNVKRRAVKLAAQIASPHRTIRLPWRRR